MTEVYCKAIYIESIPLPMGAIKAIACSYSFNSPHCFSICYNLLLVLAIPNDLSRYFLLVDLTDHL